MPQPAERQIHEAFQELRNLQEKARLKLHLAGMDARTRWDALEKRIVELEHSLRTKAQDAASSNALMKIRELSDRVNEFIRHHGEKASH
jgi:ElaB/YqjD/DUF883 family membrane-anchored ribosome-binding protein